MSDDIAAECLRWTGAGYAPAAPSTKSKVRFIKGPLPLPWMLQAMQLPGKATQVALALWYLAGLTQSRQVKISPQIIRAFGVSRDAQYDALNRLAAADLITLTRTPGRAPSVTLLEVD